MNSLSPYFVPIFRFGCRLKNTLVHWKNSNETVQWVIHELAYAIHYIFTFMTGRRIEPRQLPWLYSIGLKRSNGLTQSYQLVEHNHTFFSSQFFDDLFQGDYTQKYLEVTGANLKWVSPLLIMKGEKEGPVYFVRRCPIASIPFSITRTTVRPILVEYAHPDMAETIELEIDDSWWVVGNELLTPSFVLRALEYQPHSFYFDKDYKIRLMDQHFNIMEFGSDTYIEIMADGYEWKKEDVLDDVADEETDDEREDTVDALIRSTLYYEEN